MAATDFLRFVRRIGAALVFACLAAAAAAQVETRAEPITGPGVVTIGNIAQNARVNLRAGPSALFPTVAQLGYGTRVEKGFCIGGGSTRWCQVETVDGRHSGFVSAQYLVEGAARPPGGGAAGPDFWIVRGLPRGDRLNVRRDPSANSPALATLSEGEIVRGLGCRTSGSARWCQIRSIEGMDVTGWVNGRYLREAAGPPQRPPGGGWGGGSGGGGWGGGSGAHGPDTYVVAGLAGGDRLNVRLEPTTASPVIATLGPGERVLNLGCQMVGQARWCRIRTRVGADLTGWVNGRYLREG